MKLLTRPATRARRALTAVTLAVRSVVAPASLVLDQAATETVVETTTVVPDPAGMYEADELPELADIERAALSFSLAADNARRADRSKRAARKLLDRVPSGTYRHWIVERVASNRQTADLDRIRAIFKANGLGPVPMKDAAPSLKVRRAELVPTVPATAELVAA
jgi:hypothetical protein